WLLYYLVPRPKPPKRSALAGAAAGAVLFELAKNLFALYATHVANFERYGEGEGLGSVFGLILAFVFWVYFSGFILVIGAVVASLHEKRVHPRKAHLRRMWSRTGRFRRYRERTEAEAAEALANVHRPEGSQAVPTEDPLASDGSASGAAVPDEGEAAASSVMARRARQRAESATSP
ncbi:MAG: YhjD/YihY/BrkB family envelope integrity protein, partial [Bacteroidota bacterium]